MAVSITNNADIRLTVLASKELIKEARQRVAKSKELVAVGKELRQQTRQTIEQQRKKRAAS